VLKFSKIFPLLFLCFTCLKAQKDTFYLSNGEKILGNIHFDGGDKLDVDGQYGPIVIKRHKLNKVVSSNGTVTKYQDLTYLEKGLPKNDYLKILKPLSAKRGVFGQRLYYGNVHITRRNFFDALNMINDPEINKTWKNYKMKIIASQTLVPIGWLFITCGAYGILLFEPSISLHHNGIFYSSTNFSGVFYTGSAVILAGLTVATIGYAQAIIARKIKKRKLIGRYNSLLLQS